MKRKPSKRSLHQRKIKKAIHDAKYSNTITLGKVSDYDTFYFQDGPYTVEATFTFPQSGAYITVRDMNLDNWGTRVRYGKHPKSVHPARRNREKKKVRTEAKITAGGQTATIIKVDSDTWMIAGENIS